MAKEEVFYATTIRHTIQISQLPRSLGHKVGMAILSHIVGTVCTTTRIVAAKRRSAASRRKEAV